MAHDSIAAVCCREEHVLVEAGSCGDQSAAADSGGGGAVGYRAVGGGGAPGSELAAPAPPAGHRVCMAVHTPAGCVAAAAGLGLPVGGHGGNLEMNAHRDEAAAGCVSHAGVVKFNPDAEGPAECAADWACVCKCTWITPPQVTAYSCDPYGESVLQL